MRFTSFGDQTTLLVINFSTRLAFVVSCRRIEEGYCLQAMMMSLIIVLLLVAASISKVMAFSPIHLQHQALITHCRGNIDRGRLSSQLYMNKKKKKNRSNKSSSKSKAFGGGSTSSSTTLIKPKTTSNFQYAGTIKPGLQSPKRIVPSEKIMFPDYAVSSLILQL